MSDLFQAVVTALGSMAQPAFFPESAYLQLKTISNATSDYVNRLKADFTLDIGAAHALLGGDATGAKLLEVTAPSGFGHWVPPGVCDNSVGYYELPNAGGLPRGQSDSILWHRVDDLLARACGTSCTWGQSCDQRMWDWWTRPRPDPVRPSRPPRVDAPQRSVRAPPPG